MLVAPKLADVGGWIAIGHGRHPGGGSRSAAILTSLVGIQSEKVEAPRRRNVNGGFNRFLWPVRRTVADGFGSAVRIPPAGAYGF